MKREEKTEMLGLRISKELKIALENEAMKEDIPVSILVIKILKAKLKETKYTDCGRVVEGIRCVNFKYG